MLKPIQQLALWLATSWLFVQPLSARADIGDPWLGLHYLAPEAAPAVTPEAACDNRDVCSYQSPLSPGVLIRMKSHWIRFFGGLARYGAGAPSCVWIRSNGTTKAIPRGHSAAGSEMQASWIVASFQGSTGWERFDVPWFVSLEKRPKSISLTADGLVLEFEPEDTGHIFSMPLFGYEKLPQKDNDFAAKYGLRRNGVEPWTWTSGLPLPVIERCNWWAQVAKAFPLSLQESFSVDPAKDEITFRQDVRWLQINDAWSTPPLRFHTISPSLALAWKFPGFPIRFSAPIHDPGYFTAFGPVAGGLNADRLDITLHVLQYLHELEWPVIPPQPEGNQLTALNLINAGLKEKFHEPWRFNYDHGSRENLCWNVVSDAWYSRAIPFAADSAGRTARSALGVYMRNDVLQRHAPYHGKFLLPGPGVGSWGERGDAGKIMTDALQAIWAYGQFAGGWDLLRQRWPLIQRFFNTPDESDWVSFGRYGIAEIGDEAAPASAYARMAWALGDVDEYLLGCYIFSREMVHLYVKQRAAAYFYQHQPYNQYSPMPPQIYLTDLWGSTRGWQVDGPVWGHLSSGEHQSANRWVRFHDPDIARFFREVTPNEVRNELDWYAEAGTASRPPVYRLKAYQDWFTRDNPHNMPSLGRLQSFLINTPAPTEPLLRIAQHPNGWGASDIAVGYALLRKSVPLKLIRLIPKALPASPFVLGLQRSQDSSRVSNPVQDMRANGLALEPRWHGWGMPKNEDGNYRTFGLIQGVFPGKVAGWFEDNWISYGCRLTWMDGAVPRKLSAAAQVVAAQETTPVAVIGPFSNADDREITEAAYPPEQEVRQRASYQGSTGAVSWRMAQLTEGRGVDLSPELSRPGDGQLAYITQSVWSPDDLDAYVLTRHQGGVVVWIDAREVFRFHGFHHPEEASQFPVHLKRGWNRVLLKVESYTGNYIFQVRFSGIDRQPIPGMKYSAFVPIVGDRRTGVPSA